MGTGGYAGSASSVTGGPGSPVGNSGAGTQSFGGGFTQQQAPGSLLAPSAPAAAGGAGGAGGAMGGAGGAPVSTLIP